MAKWVEFEEEPPVPGWTTKLWHVVSKHTKAVLGSVQWYGGWRKYIFQPTDGCVLIFEEDCLRDIAAFIEARTREHRAVKSAAKVKP